MEQRLAIGADLSLSVRQIALEGIRRRDPSLSVEEARHVLLCGILGEDLANKVRNARLR